MFDSSIIVRFYRRNFSKGAPVPFWIAWSLYLNYLTRSNLDRILWVITKKVAFFKWSNLFTGFLLFCNHNISARRQRDVECSIRVYRFSPVAKPLKFLCLRSLK